MIANAGIGAQLFNLWLKAEKYSVVLTNTIPTAGSALQIILAMTWATISDLTGQRMWIAIVASALTMVANIMLSVWYIPKSALWFAFFLSYCGNSIQPIVIVSLDHRYCRHFRDDLTIWPGLGSRNNTT